MLDRIHKAFESQERFIADASHQLMTPLTTMRSAIEIKMIKSPDSKWLKSQLQSGSPCSYRERHASFSSSRCGSHTLKFGSGGCEWSGHGIHSTMSGPGFAKHIQLDLQILLPEDQLEFPTVKAERELLVQAIRNLIENAIKYSAENTNVRIEISQDYHHVQIRIQDQGLGSPSWFRKDLWTFRWSSHTSKTQGFGLNLAISWQIVKMHQGNSAFLPHPNRAPVSKLNFRAAFKSSPWPDEFFSSGFHHPLDLCCRLRSSTDVETITTWNYFRSI